LKQLTLEALRTGEAAILKRPLDTSVAMPGGGRVLLEQIIFSIQTEQGYRLGAVSRDITERKQIEAALHRANRALQIIRTCDQALVHATDEPTLLAAICRIIIEVDGYRMAWVGFAEHDAAKSVRPVAQAGFEAGYLESINITWADTERGRGPTGTAIRTGRPCLARDIPADLAYAPWRAAAIQRGYRSSVALPLIAQGQTLGALNIYAAESDAFDADEVRLLTGLADDLAFGIMALRIRAEQEEVERALRESEQRYRLISENTGDVIWTLDITTGRFTYVSPSVYRLRGFTPEEVMAQTLQEALTPESCATVMTVLRERLPGFAAGDDSQRINVYELDQPHKDGSIVPTEAVTTLLTDEAGKAVAVLGVTRDMTAHKQAEAEIHQRAEELAALNIRNALLYEQTQHYAAELEQRVAERTAELAQREVALRVANEQLQALNQLKNEFIVNISHELRTPLACLKTYHYLLEHGKPEKQDQYLASLNRETDLLWRLIENLLDISRLELGQLQPDLAPVDLNRLVTLLTGDRLPLFVERGVSLQLHTGPGLAECAADRKMLIEALTNLMTNAMLFTPAGGTVTVSTRMQTVEDNSQAAPDRAANGSFDTPPAPHRLSRWATVSVADTGPGMTAEEQTHIFERFYRGGAAQRLNLPGTGLGLPICHEIVQRHGGHITVESAIGKGSTFTIWLPVATTDD
jgi:PAS domain S-box-containing protein